MLVVVIQQIGQGLIGFGLGLCVCCGLGLGAFCEALLAGQFMSHLNTAFPLIVHGVIGCKINDVVEIPFGIASESSMTRARFHAKT